MAVLLSAAPPMPLAGSIKCRCMSLFPFRISATYRANFQLWLRKIVLDSFTLGLGREVAEEGIRVIAVAPGLTETELHARSTGEPGRVQRMTPMIPMKRAGAPDEVAQTIVFALSDAASYITATTIRVSGGR